MTLLAYRYALDPTPAQERALQSHAGAARVAFNWGLARVKANLDQRDAERTYGIPDAELTPSVHWTLYGLRKDWNAAKDTVAAWWRQVSKEAFNTGLDALARALKNWGDSRRGKRNGRPVGFPRFRSRRKARPSIRFTTGAIRCEVERTRCCPAWVGSGCMSAPTWVRPGSCPRRCGSSEAAGTSRTPSSRTSPARHRPAPALLSASTWGSRPSPWSPPAPARRCRSPTHAT